MYSAYLAGRADKNPADGWYKGELWFFDNYVIPLAKKLKECRVFGESGGEFLEFAVSRLRANVFVHTVACVSSLCLTFS